MHRIIVLTFVIILGLIVGCGSNKGKNVAKSGVLDVPSATPLPAAEPQYAAAPVNSASYNSTAINDTPVSAVAFAPAAPADAAAIPALAPPTPMNKTYTVKKGDTLFSIAKTQLGSGRDWQKIAAANPGITPTKLKAGQQIAMP